MGTISAGWMAGKSNSTVFNDKPFQFLYAAPYYTSAIDEFDFVSPYDQVRLVQIYSASPFTRNNFLFDGSLSYQTLNNFRFGIQLSVFNNRDDVYYGFQNMIINDSSNTGNVNTESPELVDDYISIKSWNSTYEVFTSYEFNIKSVFKPNISFGYAYKLKFYSTYTSNLVANQNTYLESEDNETIKEYYNSKVFQDKLYKELANDGINHYLKIGFGVRYFGTHLSFTWMKSIKHSGDYYLGQNYFNLKLSYDIMSIPLFK